MSELIDRLTAEPDDDDDGGVVYDLASIRAVAGRCIDLPDSGLIAVQIVDDLHVSFAVFRLDSGPSERDGVIVDGAKMGLIFHGNGPTGALRELRHTNWGESGYLCYPTAGVISAAFEALKEWFDV